MKQFKNERFLRFMFYICLISFTSYVLLDAFVIPRTYAYTDTSSQQSSTNISSSMGSSSDNSSASTSSDPVVTENSYSDSNITITISEVRYYDTNVYIADVEVSDISYLKTVFANGVYGKNITATTSTIASTAGAIFAINGDYYGSRNSGYVIRNGTLYRSTSSGSSQEDLTIYSDGSFDIITEGSTSADTLVKNGAEQVFSFGPGLIKNGSITVTSNEEVGKAMASNPRTAIGIIDNQHYIFLVSDGRTDESEGLTLYQLAGIMQKYGVTYAYNLDGGGSSTMWFMGKVINNPTTTGNSISERKVSDIVAIGY